MRTKHLSYSSDEEGDFASVLKQVGLKKKYGKMFAKAKILDVEDARKLSERKLRRLGVESTSERKKILKAVEEILREESSSESDSDLDVTSSESESDDEYDTIRSALAKHDLREVAKKLRKHGIEDLKALRKVDEKKLRKMGIESRRKREKTLQVLSKLCKSTSSKRGRNIGKTRIKRRNSGSTHSSTSASSSDCRQTPKSEKQIIMNILEEDGLSGLQSRFKRAGLTSFKAIEDLTPETLKEIDIDTVAIRSRVLHLFRAEVLKQFKKDAANDSSSESESDEQSPLLEALKRVNLSKHYKLLKKRGITSVRVAQELDDDCLLDIGVTNAGQRSLMLECISEADWKCKHCTTWNEHRKTCMVCAKILVKDAEMLGGAEDLFELKEKVKYVGKYRAETKTSSGAKGEVFRILEGGKFYMVNFDTKDGKTIKIRLPQEELKRLKHKRKR